MQKIKTIFIDLDRTLWDFERNSEEALLELFEQYNLQDAIESFAVFHQKYRQVNSDLWELYGKGQITKELLRRKRFEETLKYFGVVAVEIVYGLTEGYVQLSPQKTNLFPNTIETLANLKKMDMPIVIVTNGFREVQEIKLARSGLTPFVDILLCSEDVGFNKPDPNIFLEALQIANAKANNSIMVGDDFQADVLGAEKVGMHGVLFDPHHHYGHRREIQKISDLSELENLILFHY